MIETTLNDLKKAIYARCLADDDQLIASHIETIGLTTGESKDIYDLSEKLIQRVRKHPDFNKGLDAFMAEYNLDTDEGVRLMTLAEALIRIPDDETRQSLIRSKITGADWADHLGKSLSPFVNSSTRALLFTSSVLGVEDRIPFLSDIIKRLGEPGIRMGVELAMRMFSHHFVMAEALDDVSKTLLKDKDKVRYSFDMLGEAALTKEDADKYYQSYKEAILFASRYDNASISIKLSALHPRYDVLQKKRVFDELLPKLIDLFLIAREKNVQVTMDAEEADRLELGLEVTEKLLEDGRILGWHRMGLAVQAYSKRGMDVLKYLQALAAQTNEKIFVRLVKGAYWDTEVKLAQIQGVADYPVYTSKADTDIAYLACARYLIDECPDLYPQFATHNVQTVATLLHWTQGKDVQFEFQRLHGMGDQLYDSVLADYPQTRCCIYAPIGRQKELLPYLIRRLLENTANSSFVNQLARNTGLDELIRHPVDTRLDIGDRGGFEPLPKPGALYAPNRDNSAGLNLRYLETQQELLQKMDAFKEILWHAQPSPELLVDGLKPERSQAVYSPADTRQVVGEVSDATPEQARLAVNVARSAFEAWKLTAMDHRSSILLQFSDLLEKHTPELLVLMAKEAGKTVLDGLGELREAVDFVRYYCAQMKQLSVVRNMPGPNGEKNELAYEPRGVFLCISPWNFPVAIYVGQIVAALAAGNTVISKPAEEATLVAFRVWELFMEAGLPSSALQFVPGPGETVGEQLSSQEDLAGVVFTGSVKTARRINSNLANRTGPIVPFIAETGGQNVMFVDSSALPEQVVKDVLMSAFNSAGQRCSALRVLYVQDSCADEIIRLLKGSVAELQLGDPLALSTDVGPMITREALISLKAHQDEMEKIARPVYQVESPLAAVGYFLAPAIYELDNVRHLTEEHFGPILHLIRYAPAELPEIFEQVNALGYGLTLGVHSRNDKMIELVTQGINAGNKYVNRNMIGAVVESQPFGGMGLSGTGPKAGGPDYLKRFLHEVSVSTNTAAVGGAVDLINKIN